MAHAVGSTLARACPSGRSPNSRSPSSDTGGSSGGAVTGPSSGPGTSISFLSPGWRSGSSHGWSVTSILLIVTTPVVVGRLSLTCRTAMQRCIVGRCHRSHIATAAHGRSTTQQRCCLRRLQGDRDAWPGIDGSHGPARAAGSGTLLKAVRPTPTGGDPGGSTGISSKEGIVRYSGPGRSPWPVVATIVVAIVVVVALYLLFVQGR